MVSYSEILNATMTLSECKEIYNSDILFVFISCSVIIIFLLVIFIISLVKLDKCSKFIRENKQQKEFQQWKKDNKGLSI